jgi:hypothetical protein
VSGEASAADWTPVDGADATVERPPPSGPVPGVEIPEVSIRTIALRNDGRGLVAASVLTLAELPGELPDHALVGGLAVMVRLSQTHRVTTDFDEVTADRSDAIGVLVAGGAQVKGSGVYLPDSGLQLDLLDASHTLDELVTVPATDDREAEVVQMALANRYALDSAALADIVVLDGGADLQVVARVRLRVALAGALVAMKVNSALSSTRERDKAASDAYDAYRLMRAWGSDVIVDDLAAAPERLRSTAAGQIRQLFVDQVDRTAHELRRTSVQGVRPVDVDRLADVGMIADRLAP